MEKSCNICSLHAENLSSHLSLIISPKKPGPEGSRVTGETGEAAGVVRVLCFHCTFRNYKGGLYVPKYESFYSQTLDRWYKRVPILNRPPCGGGICSLTK